MLTIHGSSRFLILFFVFLKYVIFCVYPWCDLLWYNFFFIFQDTVWLVKSSWCVHCCSIHQFYWVSDRCRSGSALWWFFVRKNLSSKLVVFTSVCSWLLNVSSILTSLKYTATFLVVNALWVVCWQFMGALRFWFWSLFFFLKNVIFCVYPWCDLLWYNFFQFSGHCVDSLVILMFSLLFHSSVLLV